MAIMNAFWEHSRQAALAQGLEGEDVDRFVLAASYAAGGGILSLAKRLTGYVDMLTVAEAINGVHDVVDPSLN